MRHDCWGRAPRRRDIEASNTYEGTADIQELVVGRKITGTSAFG